MLFIAYKSRSPQLAAAARLLALSWAAALQFWIVLDGAERNLAYFAVDAALAYAFFEMSRGRWFPVPLFFLHAALAPYHLWAGFTGSDIFWMALFLNRSFELEVTYVIACSLYRIYTLRAVRPPERRS